MKRFILLIFALSSFFVYARVKKGTYYAYGRKTGNGKIIFYGNNHLQIITPTDTIGEPAKEIK